MTPEFDYMNRNPKCSFDLIYRRVVFEELSVVKGQNRGASPLYGNKSVREQLDESREVEH